MNFHHTQNLSLGNPPPPILLQNGVNGANIPTTASTTQHSAVYANVYQRRHNNFSNKIAYKQSVPKAQQGYELIEAKYQSCTDISQNPNSSSNLLDINDNDPSICKFNVIFNNLNQKSSQMFHILSITQEDKLDRNIGSRSR